VNIYLAGPIDAAEDGHQDWKHLLQSMLEDHSDPLDQQWTAYDPAAPWFLFGDVAHEPYRCAWIETVNRTAIKHCDIVVAYYPSTIMTVGTPIELADAYEQEKRIIVFSDVEYSKAVYLQNRVERTNFFYVQDYGSIESTIQAVSGKCIDLAGVMADEDEWDAHKRYQGHAEQLFAHARRNGLRGQRAKARMERKAT
jgi:nucleoside 2-deoxyribosyltransferase